MEASRYSHNMNNERVTQHLAKDVALLNDSSFSNFNSMSNNNNNPLNNNNNNNNSFTANTNNGKDNNDISRIRKEGSEMVNASSMYQKKFPNSKSIDRLDKSLSVLSAERKVRTNRDMNNLFNDMQNELIARGVRDRKLEKLKVQIFYKLNKKFDSSATRMDIYSRRNKMNILSQVILKPRKNSNQETETFLEKYNPEMLISDDEENIFADGSKQKDEKIDKPEFVPKMRKSQSKPEISRTSINS